MGHNIFLHSVLSIDNENYWPYSLLPPMQILDDEAKRKSITDCLSMMDFLRLALLIGHFVNFLMIMSLFAFGFFFLVSLARSVVLVLIKNYKRNEI